MDNLKLQIAALPTRQVGGRGYLSYRAVTDKVAAFLFPDVSMAQVSEQDYRRILETAEAVCRELGYIAVEKLTPPAVPFSDMGLYWVQGPAGVVDEVDLCEENVVLAGPGRVAELQASRLVDARLSQLGLDEVTRQHFKIPVTASDCVIDLMHRAVGSDWPNDYKGIWHDCLGMCIAGGKDISPTERLFTVIIRGVGNRRYWRFRASLQHDTMGAPYLLISLADELGLRGLFELGHVVMTKGVAALGVDLGPFLARHRSGDWGSSLDEFDRRQNDIAVKEGLRILSAYDVPTGAGKIERIWIITEADRSTTTALLPTEY